MIRSPSPWACFGRVPMRGKQPLRDVGGPTSDALAEMFLISEDLKSSFRSMRLWVERYAAAGDQLGEDDRAIALSLFRDAVVQFCGCFGAQSPKLQASVVYAGQNGAEAYFRWLQDLRDAYAAHNFGAARQCTVGVVLDELGNVVGTGRHVSVYQGPKADEASKVPAFFGVAIRFVEREINRLGDDLLAEVAEMPAAKRLSLPPAQVYGKRCSQATALSSGGGT